MSDSLVISEKLAPGVFTLTINRPNQRNALSIAVMEDLLAGIDRLEQMEKARVVIFRGNGPAFCSGLDLREAANHPEYVERSTELVARLLERVYYCQAVTIAAAHGFAVAGGAGLLAACDFAIAASELRISFPEVRRGLVPALVSTVLRRQLRERDVRTLLITGEWIDADHALEIGLVQKVVSSETLIDACLGLAKKILKGAPRAIAATKQLLGDLSPRWLGDELSLANHIHTESRRDSESAEGMAAFLEKREPSWNGK